MSVTVRKSSSRLVSSDDLHARFCVLSHSRRAFLTPFHAESCRERELFNTTQLREYTTHTEGASHPPRGATHHGMSTPTSAAESSKGQGNALFAKAKYAAAIDAYTEAITLCPRWILPIINRALCHRKRRDWIAVKSDCDKALELDRDSIKANYMLGLSLIFERRFTDAVRRLEKALEGARQSEATMQDEIWRELARAKYLEWEGQARERKAKYDAAEAMLDKLVCGGEHLVLHRASRSSHGAHGKDGGGGADAPIEIDESETMDADVVVNHQHDTTDDCEASTRDGVDVNHVVDRAHLETIREMLRAVRQRDDRTEDPPDPFCCKLTFEVFRDPVVSPSGHTYEKLAILEHLKKVGSFDPITREPLRAEQLRPNVALRNAAHAWLNQHAWAYGDIVKPDAPLE